MSSQGHYIHINDYDMSCGVRNLSGTSHPNLRLVTHLVNDLTKLAEIATQHSDCDDDDGDCAAFYLGSDVRGSSTEGFFEELRFLGTVWRSGVRKNPNTGSEICVWTWAPSQKKIKSWLATSSRKLPSHGW